jgi:hypothetical protein
MSEPEMDHDADAAKDVTSAEVGAEVEDEKMPFGFILTIVMVGVYLLYRIIQGIVLLIDWIF